MTYKYGPRAERVNRGQVVDMGVQGKYMVFCMGIFIDTIASIMITFSYQVVRYGEICVSDLTGQDDYDQSLL